MDQASFHNFISYINENMVKVQELLEKVTTMHYETSKILLEACTLFHPKILMELNEIENSGRKYDSSILSANDLKTKLSTLSSRSNNTLEDYQQMLEEIELINNSIDSAQADNT